jgi:hypothetical protein
LTVEVSEDELKVDGSIISEALEAHGLVAQLGERLRLEFAADSKRLRFDAFSDGPHRFALDDLVVSGGLVVVKGGRPLRWWRVEVSGDVTGTIGAEGIRATVEGTKVGFEFPTHTGEPSEAGVAPEPTPEPDAVRDVDVDMDVDDIDFDTDANTAPARVDRDQALDPDADTDVTDTDVDVDQDVPVEMEFDLEPPEDRLAHQIDLGRLDLHATKQDMAFIVGPGTYTVPGIHLEFEELQATAVLGRPWDRPGKLSRIQLDEGAPAQGLPIVKLTDINIAGARFTIDDVSSWVGKAELAELDPAQLQDLARGVSGSIAFRAILVRGVSEVRGFDAFDIDTAVRRGNLDGHIHGPDLAVPVENPLAPGRPPIWVNVPDWLPFQGQLMFGDANGHSSLELFRAYASLPLVGWRVLPLGVSVYWPPTDPVVVDVPTFLNPMVTALENLHLDLNVKLTDQVPLPGNNHLFLAHGSTMTLEAFPSSPAQSDVHTVVVTVDTRAARMLLMNVADVEISGVKLAKGIKAQVQHDGLAIKQLSGVVEEGHIDAATIGIIASDE